MTIRVERLGIRRSIARPQIDRYAPAAILAGYGIFILSLFFRNQLTLYINPSYVWPSTLAGVVLIVLAVVRATRPAAGAHSHEECCTEDACSCGTESTIPTWTYGALCIPLVLALLVPPRGLAGFSARQRGLQIAGLTVTHGAPTVKHASLLVDTRTFTLQDWVGALSSDPNPRDYLGKPVVLSGLAVRDPASVPTGYLMVLRYQVTCCIADARPEGLIVKDTTHGAIHDNQWVTVTGKMGATSYGGQQVAVVMPSSIRGTKAGDPYMY